MPKKKRVKWKDKWPCGNEEELLLRYAAFLHHKELEDSGVRRPDRPSAERTKGASPFWQKQYWYAQDTGDRLDHDLHLVGDPNFFVCCFTTIPPGDSWVLHRMEG